MSIYPYSFIADLRGLPVDDGEIFIGEANQDPEVFPIQAYWDAEFTIPAAQPIQLAAGYVVNAGARAEVYVNAPAYSLRLRDKKGVQVDYISEVASGVSANSEIAVAASVNALKAVDVSRYNTAYLQAAGREGLFNLRTGAPPSDPREGLYIIANNTAYYWERDWDKVNGRPEWFGAVKNSLAFDCQPAIQACLTLCPTTILSAGTYYTASTLAITKSATCLKGSGQTQTDQGANTSCSIIACTNASATIIRVGVTGTSLPATYTETVHLHDFTVNRTVNPTLGTYNATTAQPSADNSIGIDVRWSVNCHFERVFSLNSAICWNSYGTISMWYFRCSALRDKGSGGVFIGFNLDMNVPAQSTNGGNASVHFTECRVFPYTGNGNPGASPSIGWNFYQGWVDTFLTTCETGGAIEYCVRGVGRGVNSAGDGGAPFREENLRITNCTFDPGALVCIELKEGGANTAITIEGTYMAINNTATAVGVNLVNLVGSVTLVGNQFLCAAVAGIGVQANNVNNLVDMGSIFTLIQKPYVLTGCNGGQIRGNVNGRGPGALIASSDVVNITSTNRMVFEVNLNGQANSFRHAYFIGASCNNNEFRTSAVSPAPLNGNKVNNNGTAVTAETAIGAAGLTPGGNYVRGIMI